MDSTTCFLSLSHLLSPFYHRSKVSCLSLLSDPLCWSRYIFFKYFENLCPHFLLLHTLVEEEISLNHRQSQILILNRGSTFIREKLLSSFHNSSYTTLNAGNYRNFPYSHVWMPSPFHRILYFYWSRSSHLMIGNVYGKRRLSFG